MLTAQRRAEAVRVLRGVHANAEELEENMAAAALDLWDYEDKVRSMLVDPRFLQHKRAIVKPQASKLSDCDLLDDDRAASAPALHRCRKCGGTNISFYSRQTRSADEGATIFLTCEECGHKWRIRG